VLCAAAHNTYVPLAGGRFAYTAFVIDAFAGLIPGVGMLAVEAGGVRGAGNPPGSAIPGAARQSDKRRGHSSFGCGKPRRIQPVVATPRSRRCAMGCGRKQLPDPPAGARRQRAADRALRPPMRSPGRPEPSRAVQREFWRLIASGVTTVEAAESVGVSWPVGARWFRHAGGMPPLSLAEPTGRYLSFAEREEIGLLRAQGAGVRRHCGLSCTAGRSTRRTGRA
jgi:hypothetical protein